MKKILQAIDGVATTPVEGSNDMKKFLSVITEGSNPHKVALPVQMAMQHYQQPKPVTKKTSIISEYFKEVETRLAEEREEEQAKKQQLIKQYAQTIAERVLMKESTLKNKEDLQAKRKALQDIQMDPHTHKDPELKAELAWRKAQLEKEAKQKGLDEDCWKGYKQIGMKKKGGKQVPNCVPNESVVNEDHIDTVTVDIPLLIRLLEYAREDAKTDLDLHNVTEKLIQLSTQGHTLSMDNYNDIVGAEDLGN